MVRVRKGRRGKQKACVECSSNTATRKVPSQYRTYLRAGCQTFWSSQIVGYGDKAEMCEPGELRRAQAAVTATEMVLVRERKTEASRRR